MQIAAPSGAAAYNVQGSIFPSLLKIGVSRPENEMSAFNKNMLKEQLQRLLILVIGGCSMVSSKVLTVAEGNTREYVYNG